MSFNRCIMQNNFYLFSLVINWKVVLRRFWFISKLKTAVIINYKAICYTYSYSLYHYTALKDIEVRFLKSLLLLQLK